jgi:hypothetical protein
MRTVLDEAGLSLESSIARRRLAFAAASRRSHGGTIVVAICYLLSLVSGEAAADRRAELVRLDVLAPCAHRR